MFFVAVVFCFHNYLLSGVECIAVSVSSHFCIVIVLNMSSLKILSLNVRVLRNAGKRKAIFSYLKNQKASIFCLQETFSKKDDEQIWTSEWGGKIIFSHGTEHARGVCLMVNPNSFFQVESVEIDQEGRFIVAKLDEDLSIVNIYAPTDYRRQPAFIRTLSQLLMSKTNLSKVIIAGDWNTGLSKLDKSGGLPWKETNYRNALVNLMKELNLTDIYRAIHPSTRTYTYESKSLRLKSRIDFFLVSKQFINYVIKAETRTSIAPDHKAIFISLKIENHFARGPGTWKFNNLLLQDENFLQLIKDSYPLIENKYQDVENKQLLWELIKMEIRAETIRYSKTKRFNMKTREIAIQLKLEELDRKICNDTNLNGDILTEFEALKSELNEIYSTKGKEAMFRSKVKWVEQGEKPTKYFFNLEKRNYEKKIIAQLKISDGVIISDIKQINKEIEEYYKSFLTSKVPPEDHENFNESFNSFVEDLENPKLTEDEQQELENDLSKEELLNALKGFKENKTPGEDGFTKEFYETFFDLVADHLLDSYNEAFEGGKMSISQRRGIISLIPKGENYLVELTNWRPITLLNVDYKILARAIAKRIELKLPKLIHSDQTGFVKGRFIGQNVRLLNDIMEYTELNKIPGIMVLIDFEKAFDTLEWQFLHNTLKYLNFGPNLRNWISVMYSDLESGIINAGYVTNYFKISRGVRQGCPLSPILFILSAELLAQKIRQSSKSKGIKLPNNVEVKLSQFADDTTLICKDIESLKENITIINKFAAISGLKLNKKKTKAIWIGSQKNNKTKPLAIDITNEPTKTLGIYISYNRNKNNDQNFFIKIQKMETKLNVWLSRDLTLMGRTLLVKALGISKLVYSASMLCVPDEVIKRVQEKLFSYLWRNKKDKIKRTVLYQRPCQGGLNFPNVRTTIKALRLSWIGRLLSESNDAWKAIPNAYFNKYGGLQFLLKCNYDTKKLDNNISPFYSELLDYFSELRDQYRDNCFKGDLIIWNNKDITIEGKSLYWKTWNEHGVNFVQDLLQNNGKYLSYEEFKIKYNIEINFIYYCQILSAVPKSLKLKAMTIKKPPETIIEEFDVYQLAEGKTIRLSKMRCKDYYSLFQIKWETQPTSVQSWSKHYPPFANKWNNLFKNISKMSADNKLRQFSFKLLHRILVTKKELKRYKIKPDDECFFVKAQIPSNIHSWLAPLP